MKKNIDLSSMKDNEVLELLLAQSLPEEKIKPLANTLLKTFGSLTAVFTTAPKDLIKIDGIGEQTAIDLAILGQILKRI